MMEREFCHFECAVAVRFSHRDFSFVVHSFDNAAGKLLARPEIVEQKLSVIAHGASEFLQGIEQQRMTPRHH